MVLWLFAQAAESGGDLALADFIGPIAGTGLVGIFFLMIVFRVKIMPTYVYDDAAKEWERERTRLESDNADLKAALLTANNTLAEQVIPTLTLVLDSQRELVEIRRDEQAERRRRRGGPST